jgi:copper chaperone CopZ
MTTTVLHVIGMTCEHCVRAVSTELGSIPGVTEVTVDLATGAVEVTAEGPLDLDAARVAVDEAGYAVAP